MDTGLKRVIIISPNSSTLRQLKIYVDAIADVECVLSPAEALDVIRSGKMSPDVFIIDISTELDTDSAIIVNGMIHATNAAVIYCHPRNIHPDRIPHLISLIRQGAGEFIQLPTFKEEVQWVVARATTNLTGELDDIDGHVSSDTMGGTILIADDYEPMCTALSELLEPDGHEILTANSWASTREILMTHAIDILLLDIHLGDEIGSEKIPDIMAMCPNVEVVIVTAFNDVELIMNSINAGAADYIIKGRQMMHVPQKIKRILSKNR